MSVFPARRLFVALGVWTAAALVVVVFPALWPLLAAAGVALGALVLWDALLLSRLPPVHLRRDMPVRAFVGRAATVTVAADHAGVPVRVDVFEDVPPVLVEPAPVCAPVVAGTGCSGTLSYAVRPTQRGDARFGRLIGLLASPLGLLCRRVVGGDDDVLAVYPDTTRFLRPEALDPRRVLAAGGARPRRERGAGMEFESLREYVPGDDPRRVDWAATARRGRLITRQYQHERNHTVILALDTSRLMGARVDERTKLDHAVDAALALAYAALVSGDRVGLVVFDREVRGTVAPRAHRRALGPFVDVLRTVAPQLVEPDYRVLVRDLGARQRQRALVVVLTDFVETDAATVAGPLGVLAGRHRVLLVALRDRAYAALNAASPAGVAVDDVYRRLVLEDLLAERARVLHTLARRGVQTLDLPPQQVTAAVLNRYLALRTEATL